MSDEKAKITGSAAREHEATGGNVKAGQSILPQAGSAAFAAETEAKEASHRVEYRRSESMRLPQVRGARTVAAEPPKPDLSQRTAADYLPAHLKAKLIAEGKLSATGQLVTPVPAAAAPEPLPSEETGAKSDSGAEAPVPANWLGSIATRLRNLFR